MDEADFKSRAKEYARAQRRPAYEKAKAWRKQKRLPEEVAEEEAKRERRRLKDEALMALVKTGDR